MILIPTLKELRARTERNQLMDNLRVAITMRATLAALDALVGKRYRAKRARWRACLEASEAGIYAVLAEQSSLVTLRD